MHLSEIQSLLKTDMETVNQVIQQQFNSDIALINQLAFYIIHSGGKRIRPMLTLLAGKTCGAVSNKTIDAAALIELIHTATLLHDDVVDESTLRRNKPTANAEFGNAASVLVGDYLYTRAFQMMTHIGNMRILQLMSDAVNIISEGEVQQLLNCNDPDTTEDSYFRVIYSKTSKLFEMSTQIGGILSNASPEIEKALANYGVHLGTAFQLTDDYLDYQADVETLGKNIGDDLAEGKPTLPLIYAITKGTPEQVQRIRRAITDGDGMQDLEYIFEILKDTKALEYTQQRAAQESQLAIEALAVLEDSLAKSALISLAHLACSRQS